MRILSNANDHLGIDVADTSCTPQPGCRFGTVTPLFPNSAFTSSLYCPGCGPGGMLVQTGYVHGYAPGQTVVSDIAIDDACDPSGYGQARRAFAARRSMLRLTPSSPTPTVIYPLPPPSSALPPISDSDLQGPHWWASLPSASSIFRTTRPGSTATASR